MRIASVMPPQKAGVGLEDVDGLEHGEIAEGEAGGLRFAGGDRYRAGGSDLGHAGLVVGDHRLLEPGQVAVGDHVDEALGVGDGVGAVGVDHQLHLRPERGARGADAGGRDVRGTVHGADAHLHRAEAAGVDVGLQLLADAVGRRPAARGIGGQPVGLAAAEQAPDGLAERLAEDVPERDVDRADGGDRDAAARQFGHGVAGGGGLLVAHAVVEHLPDLRDVGGGRGRSAGARPRG
jgi:hypothetical protein